MEDLVFKRFYLLNYHRWQALPLDRRKALNEDEPSTSKSVVRKDALDPLNDVRRYLGCEGIKNIVKVRHLDVKKLTNMLYFQPFFSKTNI